MAKIKTLEERYVIDLRKPSRFGGMAEVRQARDMTEVRDVAIKFIASDFARDRYTREAFDREQRSLQSLEHPNIIALRGGGIDPEDSRRYLVLDWAESNLDTWLSANSLGGWDDFYERIGEPLLSALVHAYQKGFVHRDVKPGNILIDASGTVLLSDFGIAKFRAAPSIGTTLAGFRSPPYAPPENDDGTASDTRDVYSFAVVALRCLTKPLVTYDDVYEALEEVDLPSAIDAIIHACLDKEPEKRPPHIVAVAELIRSAQHTRFVGRDKNPECYLQPTRAAVERLGQYYPSLNEDARRNLILEDLSGAFCLLPLRQAAAQPTQRADVITLSLLGDSFQYRLVLAETRDHFIIQGVERLEASVADIARADAFQPAVTPRLGKPPRSVVAADLMTEILLALSAHQGELARRKEEEARNRVFTSWQRTLSARDAVERSQRRSISYEGARRRGSRIEFGVAEQPDSDIVGEPWYLPLPGNLTLSGEIESVSSSAVVLWVDADRDVTIPQRGLLRFDTRASRRALDKQQAALDAIRFERCVRPELKNLLASPEQASEPDPAIVDEYFQSDLDDDKRAIVASALGTRDFLLVEGPPGTGKTRLITELILQSLRRSPNARILLSSQTHIALDNALEKVHSGLPGLRIVRIGRHDDPRMAESVKPLLLQGQAEEWLKTVAQKSHSFVTAWAESHGVNREEIDLGMRASAYRLAVEDEIRADLALTTAEEDLSQSRAAIATLEAAGMAAQMSEHQERARQLEESLYALRQSRVRAAARTQAAKKALSDRGDYGRDLTKLGPSELREWEDALLSRDEHTRKCKSLIDLSEEWILRFGKSADFHAALLTEAQVVAGTCVGFMSARGIQHIEFDLCIVDEASKANVSEMLMPLARSRAWILVGDRKQLPPFVETAMQDPRLLADSGTSIEEVRETLVDYLVERLPQPCLSMLTTQHRMAAPIGSLISACFYDGRLVSVRPSLKHDAIPQPVTWLSTSDLPNATETNDGHSYRNLTEVRQALKLIKRVDFFNKARCQTSRIVFLTGYLSQKAEFERAFAAERSQLTTVEVTAHTVDAFQGREADIAIYSVTRSNREGTLGFLGDYNRLNVALSRGRDALVIVGDLEFCTRIRGQNPFLNVINHIRAHPQECAIEAAPRDA